MQCCTWGKIFALLDIFFSRVYFLMSSLSLLLVPDSVKKQQNWKRQYFCFLQRLGKIRMDI